MQDEKAGMWNGLTLRGSAHVVGLKLRVDRAVRRVADRWPEHSDLICAAIEGGHRTRPIATLLACEAVRGAADDALLVAVAVELAHKASVIRDDLADGDRYRGGRPTFHARFGTPLAVAVSDVLCSESFALIETLDAGARERCYAHFVRAYRDMAAGQLFDLNPAAATHAGAVDGLHINQLKTGRLGELAFRCGGIAGGGSSEQVEALASFGAAVGTAFQVLNDTNNLLGAEARGGRSIATDLRQRKKTVLWSRALSIAPAETRAQMMRFEAQHDEISDQQALQMREILLRLGMGSFGQELADNLLEESRASLKGLPDTLARDILCRISAAGSFTRMVF